MSLNAVSTRIAGDITLTGATVGSGNPVSELAYGLCLVIQSDVILDNNII